MITARATRLLRVPHLSAFRQGLARLAIEGTVAAVRRRVIIVPTRAAAEQLRRSIEDASLATGARAIAIPNLLTRDEWLTALQDDLCESRPRLSIHEREVLLDAAARAAVSAGAGPPFTIRPGLLAEMLVFYDELGRHQKTVDDFARLVGGQLERDAESDRGAARMWAQTRFMVATFRGYQDRLATAGVLDEHLLRVRLLETPATGFSHVIVAVGDRAGDAHGLWPADFDLLTRLAGVERLDVVATEAALAAGFLERVRQALPGLAEVMDEGHDGAVPPVVVAPSGPESHPFATYRDREDELAAILRRVKRTHQAGTGAPLWQTGIVFKGPLPYVYLASQLFPSAGVPYQAFDALPLASEPYAALVDVIIEGATAGFTRAALVALMRSPMLSVGVGVGHGARSQLAVSRLDRALGDAGYLGDTAELERLAAVWRSRASTPGGGGRHSGDDLLAGAADMAVQITGELEALTRDATPSHHLDVLLAFLVAHDRPPREHDGTIDRNLRARAAIHAALSILRDAHRRYDNDPRPFPQTAAAIHRWIEQQTFAPRQGSGGVQLIDADAARFANLDTMYLVGLTRHEWPEHRRRSVFFPVSLLSQLGWPPEADALAAQRAAFEDLLRVPSGEVLVSSITLEDDAIVEASPYLEDVSQSGLEIRWEDAPEHARIFQDEAVVADPVRPDVLQAPTVTWLAARMGRTSADDVRFHGQAFSPGIDSYRVSAIDQYLDCPFKFFATHVLKLDEDPQDRDALDSRAQGEFVHRVFERFFREWHESGRRAISAANLAEARTRFGAVVDEALPSLPEADATLLRARLLGSAAAPGFGDVVFQIEIDQPEPVVDRLVEFPLSGDTVLGTGPDARTVSLRAKADRVDLLANGTFRIYDYKLGRAPDTKRAVQLPAYAAAARQRLDRRDDRSWQPSDVAYIAFGKGDHRQPVAAKAGELSAKLADGETRLLETLLRIERGEFPPSPHQPRRCAVCPFSTVCRKEYVGDE